MPSSQPLRLAENLKKITDTPNIMKVAILTVDCLVSWPQYLEYYVVDTV